MINIDEVATGALVNAIAVAGRRLSVALSSLPRRRREHDLTVARWFETYQLTGKMPDLVDLSPALRHQLAGDEVQAALQELLAARLTDASEADATRARDLLHQAIATAAPASAEPLADYYDDQICALAARLQADDPPLLAQIRAEAFSTRMIAILNAIERHSAALATRPDRRTEARFLTGYRHHVTEKHGKLEPPDLEHRRRVPIADIYVPTVIFEDIYSERPLVPPLGRPTLTVLDLPGRLDRSVLLGDPGGGKTTASNVLMHHFASDPAGQIPFLVTLRDFAAHDPPERSVVGYIEYTLETLYQCPPPPGLIELLLLTARAVVIFDGLDELLDTSRRADVTTRVEQFCLEYPLAPVLVTSRLIGYDQARLDDRQFTCYRLGGFTDDQVAEYVRKWFALDEGAHPGDADAFLVESEGVPDLRSNPLLLSLMCILYRGAGSLPLDRADVYEKCADLLIRNWDAYRRIHRELRAGRQVKPALRHLAWWLFTRYETQAAVTERELVAKTADFLHDRGFESRDDACEAAREFVEFCRGRMWVFTEAGTTAAGEKLYSFTHRTFLEYFAGAHLAYASDSPERLAGTLVKVTASQNWWVVGELALQIKDRTSDCGAQRIYAALLDDTARETRESWSTVRPFLARCLRSVDPSPRQVRELTRRLTRTVIDIEAHSSAIGSYDYSLLNVTGDYCLADLVECHGPNRGTVAEEITTVLSAAISSADPDVMLAGIRVTYWLLEFCSGLSQAAFWESTAAALLRKHADEVIRAAEDDPHLRWLATDMDVISLRSALSMPGGLSPLLHVSGGTVGSRRTWLALRRLLRGQPLSPDSHAIACLEAIGDYLRARRGKPWFHGRAAASWLTEDVVAAYKPDAGTLPGWVSLTACLGAVGLVSILAEGREKMFGYCGPGLGPVPEFYPYLARRRDPSGAVWELPELPVPEEFRRIFRDWADGRVNFTAPEPDGGPG